MHPGLAELLSDAGIHGATGDRPAAEMNVQSANIFVTALQQATDQIQQLASTTKGNSDSASASTQSLPQIGSVPNAGNGTSGTVEQLAGSFLQGNPLAGLLAGGGTSGGLFGGLLGGLFGSIPLLSDLTDLFGGGPSQPPPLTHYQAPLSQNFEESVSGGVVGDTVYGATGQPRQSSITELALQGLQAPQSNGSSSSGGAQTAGSPQFASSPQITVQVQAMDSQSFMDRATDIASAVRSAMLNMHSINDVVNDL